MSVPNLRSTAAGNVAELQRHSIGSSLGELSHARVTPSMRLSWILGLFAKTSALAGATDDKHRVAFLLGLFEHHVEEGGRDPFRLLKEGVEIVPARITAEATHGEPVGREVEDERRLLPVVSAMDTTVDVLGGILVRLHSFAAPAHESKVPHLQSLELVGTPKEGLTFSSTEIEKNPVSS